MAGSMTDALFAKFEALIVGGKMQPGSRFPTQSEIAKSEQVSRTVVREAVARLEAQGLTVSRQGSGVYVSDDAQYRALQVTRTELTDLADFIGLLEVRLAIESEMAAMAAVRRTTSDISAIRDALDEIAKVSHDPKEAALADVAFHLSIAAATHNDYYARIIRFLGIRLVPPRSVYLGDATEGEHAAYVAKVHEEHRFILEAIVRMDGDAARVAARRHMQESLSRHSELSDRARAA